MRSLISLIVLPFFLVPGGVRAAPGPASAAAAELWPLDAAPLDAPSLAARRGRIDQLAATLPPELGPAVRYQKLFVGVISGAPENEWSGEIKRMAETPGDDGMTRGLREAARFWLARLGVKRIGAALRGFYVQEIHFPENLSFVESGLPPEVQRDPWGEPWSYKPKAPEAFGTLEGQAYALGPARLPSLSLLRDIRRARHVNVPPWKITAVAAGGRPALEFRGGGNVALIQAGGAADGCCLLFIGENWALMAQVDQLFTVAF